MDGIVLVKQSDLDLILKKAVEAIEPDEVLNLKETAKFLRVSDNALRTDCKSGYGPPYQRTGREYKFSKKAVMKWLERGRD